MKKYIHINQHVIKSNHKNNKREPVITVKTYKSNTYGHQVHILGECKVVYSPDKPLSCGAKGMDRNRCRGDNYTRYSI